MVKRGRSRKTEPREKNGKPQRLPEHRRRDRGTKEIQFLREWYAGKGDPARTSYPLGILYANQAITEAQHSAGCNYAWLHWAVFGRVSLGAVSLEFMDRGAPTLRDRPEEERRLERLHALFGLYSRARRVLDNLVIYERIPRWMRPVDPRLSDVAEGGLFVAAIRILANPDDADFSDVA